MAVNFEIGTRDMGFVAEMGKQSIKTEVWLDMDYDVLSIDARSFLCLSLLTTLTTRTPGDARNWMGFNQPSSCRACEGEIYWNV